MAAFIALLTSIIVMVLLPNPLVCVATVVVGAFVDAVDILATSVTNAILVVLIGGQLEELDQTTPLRHHPGMRMARLTGANSVNKRTSCP